MTFNEVLKSITNGSNILALSPVNVLSTLTITLLISMIIYYTYIKNYNGVAYNHSFNVSLLLMSLITSMIILTISSNLVLSLGMVGALSIVRFRSAIKDPLDIVYLFWALSVGITTGARLYLVALIGTCFISAVIFVFMKFTNKLDIFLLIIQFEESSEDEVLNKMSELQYSLKSKRAFGEMIEMTVEIKRSHSGTQFVSDLNHIIGVKNVSFVSYNGDYIQ